MTFLISVINVYFQISEIVILDIHNNYFRYQKSNCQFFDIQNNDTSICDI